MTPETEIREEDVRREHLTGVSAARHWGYLFGVLIGAFLVMVLLIALLESA